MAPSVSDPGDLRLVLNPARRKALLALVGSIVTQLRKQIESSFEQSTEEQIAPLFQDSLRTPSPQDLERERMRKLDSRIEKHLSNPRMLALKDDALSQFEKWSRDLRNVMRKTCDGPDDLRTEQRRKEWQAANNPPPPMYSSEASHPKDPEAIAKAEAADIAETKAVSLLQLAYPPQLTRLITISRHDRICVISCMILILLSLGSYSAYSRVLLCHLTSSLGIPIDALSTEETEIARTLMLASKALSADEETKQRQEENASARRWKVGLASVAGAAIIGVTGGLAAPVVFGAIGGVMGGVGLGGVASFLGIFAMNGALVGTLFGAFGAKMTGEMVDNYAKEVSDFKFLPVDGKDSKNSENAAEENDGRRLRVTIGINGWLKHEDDVVQPWKVLGKVSEVFALRYEMDALVELGTSLESMVSSYAWSYVKLEILKRTVLATLWSALWPVYLLKMATSVDNPFSVARNRSEKAGEVLADALINKAQGERPVTLIGYSLGARVIHSCLRSLAARRAFGLVENVILIGSPIPSNRSNWQVMKSVVAGKLTNVYSENDYILGFLYRATSIQLGVAGLQNVEDVEGVENLDLSKEVSGHLRYPELLGKIMKRCGVEGVMVDDTDIEKDTSENLIDIDIDGYKTDLDAKGFTKGGLLEMLDSEPGAESQPSRTDPARGRSLQNSGYQGESSSLQPQTRPVAVHSENSSSATHAVGAGMASLSIQNRDDDTDSDSGGIQMIDNDTGEELHVLHGDPEPDDFGSSSRNFGQSHGQAREHNNLMDSEPKSLGSFPKQPANRVRASELGLY